MSKALKILIISRSFYPIIAPRSFRATELAKELATQGHNVTVMTHTKGFDHSSFSKDFNINVIDFVEDKWFDIKVEGKGFFIKIIKVARGVLKYLFMFPDIQLVWILKRFLKDYKDFDLLISIAVPYSVHFGVAMAKSKNKEISNIWIADCGDPFFGNREKKFQIPFYFKYIERWFCKKPDFITVPIHEAVKAFPVLCQNKIKVIPQGFKIDDTLFQKQFSPNPIPHFAYAGSFSEGVRDPLPFLNYLLTLDDDFKFIVYTRKMSLLTPFISKLGSKLEIKDYIPRDELLIELSRMDFLINFCNKESVQSPSKLIDYALSGRPVLNIESNKINKYAFEIFLSGNYNDKAKLPNINDYRIEKVARQFIDLCT